MLAMWFFFWDSSEWGPIPPIIVTFWCALTGSSAFTGGGSIEQLG